MDRSCNLNDNIFLTGEQLRLNIDICRHHIFAQQKAITYFILISKMVNYAIKF